jgi:hypothetical protein
MAPSGVPPNGRLNKIFTKLCDFKNNLPEQLPSCFHAATGAKHCMGPLRAKSFSECKVPFLHSRDE